MAQSAGIETSPSVVRSFSGEYDTFLTKRFDRTGEDERIHFASAMTLLGKKDGDGGDSGVSYLDLADFLMKNGAQANKDLEQLWRRIVFFICVSNTDDHLRNHGFLLKERGWVLSPAYDMNPVATGDGLALNISRDDNSQNLDIARSVAPIFRLSDARAEEIISEVVLAVSKWPEQAKRLKLPAPEISTMRNAFRMAS